MVCNRLGYMGAAVCPDCGLPFRAYLASRHDWRVFNRILGQDVSYREYLRILDRYPGLQVCVPEIEIIDLEEE